jgi:RNA-directed DNA polymerase
MAREKSKGRSPEGESTEAGHRGGTARSSDESPVMGVERRGCVVQGYLMVNQQWEESVSIAKPYEISKKLVWEAWKRIKANKGTSGVDSQTIQDIEGNLKNNLYKVWNRMSSGSYFPPPVRRVEIPKEDGGKRPLGIPTVADRVAQMVVLMLLEPEVEPIFHQDSYGYRPGKSAVDAVETARKRCWSYDWVIDLDIRGFFDNIDHELLMKAVRKHAQCKWMQLYIERWLKAPVQMKDGTLECRDKGTPQGGVISPLLANLFLHYAFDAWMVRTFPGSPFERYADDVVVHCKTMSEAEQVKNAIKSRLAECKLEMHPGKTKIVYCKDGWRKGTYPTVCFDFLGFSFHPRQAINRKGRIFTGFLPAISNKSLKRIGNVVRSWRLRRWIGYDIEDLATALNPVIRGWLNYYGRFYKTRCYKIVKILDFALVNWARKKFRKQGSYRKSTAYILRVKNQRPTLFCHWQLAGASLKG